MTRDRAEGPFRVELDAFPFVHMSSPSVAQFDQPSASSFFECIDRGLERGQPFVILLDARGVPHADEVRRKDFMRLLTARRADVEQRVVAFAAVCGSPLERGLVTAFMWFIRLSLPIRIFGNEGEAKAWLLARYEAAGAGGAHTGRAVAGS
ncbi:MAG: hypothetical protein QM778_13600 [Myxococcales bacterium]